MLGSVSIKSTGQSASSTRSTNMRTMTADPANPHPTAPSSNPGMGPAGTGEYREIPSPGITSTGVGNFKGSDAAHETMTKHP